MTYGAAGEPRPYVYAKRPIRPLGLHHAEGGITFKGYGIHHARDPGQGAISRRLLDKARDKVEEVAHDRMSRTAHHGVGFYIVHEGIFGTFLIVDWWAKNLFLHHLIFQWRCTGEGFFESPEDGSLTSCLWDLAVIIHERHAWVRKLKAHGHGSSAAYLDDFADLDL